MLYFKQTSKHTGATDMRAIGETKTTDISRSGSGGFEMSISENDMDSGPDLSQWTRATAQEFTAFLSEYMAWHSKETVALAEELGIPFNGHPLK